MALYPCIGTKDENYSRLIVETIQARRKWNEIFKLLEGKKSITIWNTICSEIILQK